MRKVSIAIRSRNDIPFIERVINAVLSQTFQDFEILSFDNASTDGTKGVLAKYPNIKLFSIPEGKYIPGQVLNLAMEKSQGEIVVFNNSDSIPQNRFWLESLIEPLLTQKAQASYAKQVSRPDALPWVQLDYQRAFGEKEFSKNFFSMVSSAATKNILKQFHFSSTITYSEDILWSKHLRDNGISIVYCPKAIVEHSHNYTLAQAKKRFFGEGYADGEIWGIQQNYPTYIKGIIGAIARDFSYLVKTNQINKFPASLRYRFVQKTAYHEGIKQYFKEQSKRYHKRK